MADEEAVESEEVEEGGSNKKMIIIFAVVLLIAVGGSVAGTMVLLGGDDGEVTEEVASDPEPSKAIYHEMRPAFVVNYTIANKPRFLQTQLAVMARQPEVIDAVVMHSPLMRARVLDYLTDQSFQELQTDEGKTLLQEGLVGVLNEVLSEHQAEGSVEAVLFSSFVMQ